MIDFVIRNARVAGRHDALTDIGFENGRIAAVEPNLVCDAPSYDADGCLCCGGLIETHIHLDKSRIIDRCAPETERMANAVKRVKEAKKTFTVEDVHARARETLENCIKHGATRMRTHVEVDPGVGMRGFEGVQALVDEYKWAIDIELCVFPQEGLTNNPGTDELLVEGLKRGAKVDRRGARLRHRSCRPDPARVRAGARIRRRHRHASRFRQHAGRSRRASGLRSDRAIQARRPRRDRARDQALDARSGRAEADRAGGSPTRALR